MKVQSADWLFTYFEADNFINCLGQKRKDDGVYLIYVDGKYHSESNSGRIGLTQLNPKLLDLIRSGRCIHK